MRLIADRQLSGDYGNVAPGQTFETNDAIGHSLLSRGLAREARSPRVEYETKVVTPAAPEVSARQPFRDVLMPNEESPNVVNESDTLLSATNVLEPGITDRSGRRGRARSAAGNG